MGISYPLHLRIISDQTGNVSGLCNCYYILNSEMTRNDLEYKKAVIPFRTIKLKSVNWGPVPPGILEILITGIFSNYRLIY